MFLWHAITHWLSHVTGARQESGPWYGFWSGFGANFGEFAIVGGLITVIRRQNCGVKGCYRLGRHEYDMDGVKHRLCRKHHPGVDQRHSYTAAEFAAHHEAHKAP